MKSAKTGGKVRPKDNAKPSHGPMAVGVGRHEMSEGVEHIGHVPSGVKRKTEGK